MSYGRQNSMADVAKAFPDQCEWVKTFCQEGGDTVAKTSVKRFLSLTGYEDALQYLTMDLCIFGAVASGVDASIVEGLEPQLKKLRLELGRPGRPAHPAVVVARALEGQKGK